MSSKEQNSWNPEGSDEDFTDGQRKNVKPQESEKKQPPIHCTLPVMNFRTGGLSNRNFVATTYEFDIGQGSNVYAQNPNQRGTSRDTAPIPKVALPSTEQYQEDIELRRSRGREAARSYRERKKEAFDNMVAEVNHLRAENAVLREIIAKHFPHAWQELTTFTRMDKGGTSSQK